MKRLLMIVPMILLSALLLFFPAFAEEAGEIPEIQPPPDEQKTVTNVEMKSEIQNRFLKLGETPDFTGAEFIVTYYDGSFDTMVFEEEFITSWDVTKKGRQPAVLTVSDSEIIEYFIVYDDSIDVLDFKDVYKGYWGYKHIRRAAQAGFFVGLSPTEFGVADGMTRAQFCQMIYQIYRDDVSVITREKPAQFTDVNVGSWYYEAVTACAESGIVNGRGDGTFDPNSKITRQDVAVIMMNVLSGADAVKEIDVDVALADANKAGIAAGDFEDTSEYAKKYVAAALGVIYYGDEKGNINPKSNITRAECAAMCSNLYFKDFTDPEPEKKVVYLSPEGDKSKVYAIWDRGDEQKSQYTEHIQTSLIAQKVKDLLEQLGYEVHIADPTLSIRDKDKNDNPQDYRGAEAKRLGADAYIAIHTNAGPSGENNGRYQGTTCYYNGNNEGAKELSDLIYRYLSELTPTKDRGSLNDMLTAKPFAEIRLPEMANVLIEVEFHDYANYAQWIVDNIDKIAAEIARGTDEYLKTLE